MKTNLAGNIFILGIVLNIFICSSYGLLGCVGVSKVKLRSGVEFTFFQLDVEKERHFQKMCKIFGW